MKLELGDVYVFEDLVWDASLIFSQIVLDFKDDPLGHEAKFRNARISYFTGDFAWAQTQLDALKASTSKLMSNDAINLSFLSQTTSILIQFSLQWKSMQEQICSYAKTVR